MAFLFPSCVCANFFFSFNLDEFSVCLSSRVEGRQVTVAIFIRAGYRKK